jgi:aquaporin Z
MNSLKDPATFSPRRALVLHWPEYLIEGWALGMFMLSAALVTTLMEAPAALLHSLIGNERLRLGVIGTAMGATAVALIYCPWGKRSGAHMNPAVTLAFLSLGRISPVNAVFYITAQFIGGLAGVLLALALLGKPFSDPPVLFVATLPGSAGFGAAFAAELAISFGLMLAILLVSNIRRCARYTGLIAGLLIACYVTFEAPLSGMSMNPARTLASAWPAGVWTGLWIYFTAPPAGMWLAARVFDQVTPRFRHTHHAAKIVPTHADIRQERTMSDVPDTTQRSDEEWKQQLPAETYSVMRKHGTERAGTSPLNKEYRAGRYACAACGLPLFESSTKFDSGTGWPSFFAPLPEAVGTSTDRTFGMARTEVHCARCGGHLGHVFPDGPQPTGDRYCMNGVALKFEPK